MSTQKILSKVNPENLANATGNPNPPDYRWLDERLEHSRQHRFFKNVLFWLACFICGILYFLFFTTIVLLFTHTVAMQVFVAHKHILILTILLLLVPSAMLWGMVRAVYKVESSAHQYADVLKEGMKMHPML